MRQDLQYLYNTARDFMGTASAWEAIASGLPIEGTRFRGFFQADVESQLRKWSWEKLGKLAAHGRGDGSARVDWEGEASAENKETLERFNIPRRATLLEVGFERSITSQMSGYRLLLTIAGLTVVAAMLDLARQRERERQTGLWADEEAYDRTLRDFTHHGHGHASR